MKLIILLFLLFPLSCSKQKAEVYITTKDCYIANSEKTMRKLIKSVIYSDDKTIKELYLFDKIQEIEKGTIIFIEKIKIMKIHKYKIPVIQGYFISEKSKVWILRPYIISLEKWLEPYSKNINKT